MKDDLDLHCDTPSGHHIHFSDRTVGGGELDVDANCDHTTHTPVENIVFQKASGGHYRFWVESGSCERTPFTVMLTTHGMTPHERKVAESNADCWPGQTITVCDFDYVDVSEHDRFKAPSSAGKGTPITNSQQTTCMVMTLRHELVHHASRSMAMALALTCYIFWVHLLTGFDCSKVCIDFLQETTGWRWQAAPRQSRLFSGRPPHRLYVYELTDTAEAGSTRPSMSLTQTGRLRLLDDSQTLGDCGVEAGWLGVHPNSVRRMATDEVLLPE
eukprot:COSAG06_NODE_7132_length_2618_cov_3.130607_3_plen_272_part_00